MTSPIPYPHIPEAAQDTEADTLTGIFASEPFSVQRTIGKTSSEDWGDSVTAAARSVLEPTVTAENEALFRTHHPSLASASWVMAVRLRRSEPYIWVVVLQPDTDTSLIDTHAGDREIHFRPAFLSPFLGNPRMNTPAGPSRLPVNVRRMLTAKDLNDIRLYWPKSIGIRILISGLALLIYANESDVSHDIARCPTQFGDLELGYVLQNHVPTAEAAAAGDSTTVGASQPAVESGHAVSLAAGAPPSTALGLRLRLKSGVEAITVATHGFVSDSRASPMEYLSYWMNSTKKSLSRFLPFMASRDLTSDDEVRETITYRSPLGKTVWLSNTDVKLGRIAYSYDEPHPSRPFPSGYQHDISLVVGPLVDILPPGGIRELQWAEYQDAFDNAGSVFVCKFNADTGLGHMRRGHIVSEEVQKAVIEGSEYLWDLDTMSSSAAIIWRTIPTRNGVEGWSGSALCLGKALDRLVKVVAFQSFQLAIPKEVDKTGLYPKGGVIFESYKGGYVLPQEVRESEIIVVTPESQ
ncbi:hypothetical protein FQN49_001928 [Arthroderma sp. PD_2]|nr:hypothetical protein FQN49_001928 [Arthroderma sp. PD_2]